MNFFKKIILFVFFININYVYAETASSDPNSVYDQQSGATANPQRLDSNQNLIKCFANQRTTYGFFKPNGTTYYSSSSTPNSISMLHSDKKFYTLDAHNLYITPGVYQDLGSLKGYPVRSELENLGRDPNGQYLFGRADGKPYPTFIPFIDLDNGRDIYRGTYLLNPDKLTHTVIRPSDISKKPNLIRQASEAFHQEILLRFEKLVTNVEKGMNSKSYLYARNNDPQPKDGWRRTEETPFMEESELQNIKNGICSCLEVGIGVDEAKSAVQGLIGNPKINILTDEAPGHRMLKEEDLACMALTS